MASLSRKCTRCFSTALRVQQPAPHHNPVPRDWENAPIVTRRPKYKAADFSHIGDPAARRAFEKTSKAYYLILGHDPGASLCCGELARTGQANRPSTKKADSPACLAIADEVMGRAPSSSEASTSSLASAAPSPSSESLPPALAEEPLHVPKTYQIPPPEDPLLGFLTNLMMKDGKKATARKHVALVLETLRLRSSQHPLSLLREAIRISSPNVRLAQQKKGGKQVSVPIPLGERQRVRQAIAWILDASDKRKNPNAGGSKKFGERVAMEIEAVMNGSSEVLKRKEQLHNTATVNRANAR